MIIDGIENISKYNTIISENVINFIKTLSPSTPCGRYEIDKKSYANVDEYEPKPYENCKFEAHKKFIDIQMVLSGCEDLEYTLVKGLDISEKYDENRDVMFFENSESDCVHLTPYKFAYINTYEAHKPQIKTSSSNVKKVVIKIKV